jgi:hypothetical protein
MKIIKRFFLLLFHYTPERVKRNFKEVTYQAPDLERLEKDIQTLRLEVKRLQGLIYLSEIIKEQYDVKDTK